MAAARPRPSTIAFCGWSPRRESRFSCYNPSPIRDWGGSMSRWWATAFLVLTLSAPARAQTAQVSGTVVDATGAGVPGAAVSLVGATSRQFTTSGAAGAYTFSNVASGKYTVTVS